MSQGVQATTVAAPITVAVEVLSIPEAPFRKPERNVHHSRPGGDMLPAQRFIGVLQLGDFLLN